MREDFQKQIHEDLVRIAAEARDRREKADKALEGVPFECRRYPSSAINRIILIKKDLKRITADLDIRSALAASRAYLASHKWQARFTTGLVGKPDPGQDSLYYLSPEGISLRLKMANAESGDINQVMRSFKEITFFEDDQSGISLAPKVGLTVQEFVSPEFLELQNGDSAHSTYQSRIRIYKQGGRIIQIRNVPNGLQHTGHEVNAVF